MTPAEATVLAHQINREVDWRRYNAVAMVKRGVATVDLWDKEQMASAATLTSPLHWELIQQRYQRPQIVHERR